MVLRRYVAVLRKRVIVATLTGLVVLAAVLLYALHQAPVYQATAQALINREEMDLANGLAGQPSDLAEASDNGRLSLTQVGVAQSPIVARRTIAALGLRDTTAAELASRVAITGSATTDLLTFSATAGTQASAIRLVNGYVAQYLLYTEQLNTVAVTHASSAVETLLAQAIASHGSHSLVNNLRSKAQQLTVLKSVQTGTIQSVSPAVAAAKVRPKPLEDGVIAVILALILGIVAALAADAFDTRVEGSEEVTAILQLPLLARIAVVKMRGRARTQPIVSDMTPRAAEDFRILRAALDFANADDDVNAMLVASAVEGEGKTTVAANLAITLAKSGRSVALVDLDLHRASIAKLFGIHQAVGATSVAAGHTTLAEALVHFRFEDGSLVRNESGLRGDASLCVLPSGPLPPDPGELVTTKAIAALTVQLRSLVDVVVIDGPPLLGMSDLLPMSRLADGLLFVARPDVVTRAQLREAHRLLQLLSVRLLGVVTNAVAEALGEGYRYGPGYYGVSTGSEEVQAEGLADDRSRDPAVSPREVSDALARLSRLEAATGSVVKTNGRETDDESIDSGRPRGARWRKRRSKR